MHQQRILAVEPLEDRSLLSVSTAEALLEALTVYESGDKGDSSSPVNKIGYNLASIYACYETADYSGTDYSGVSFSLTKDIDAIAITTTTSAKYVLIDVSSTSSDPTSLEADLAKLGFVETGVYGRMVSGWLPIDQIDELASLSDVLVANAELLSSTLESNLASEYGTSSTTSSSSSGSVISEGVAAMNADTAQSTYDVDGSGVTVGILSDSFNADGGYATDVADGELPSDVTILQDDLDGTDEGRAMAQIVHDVAPGADIMFATADLGQASFAQNIEALADAGCDIIVDDVYYYAEPFFENGVIAQAVNTVADEGVVYFSAAGNSGTQSYESSFTAGSTYADGAFSSYGSSSVHFYGGTALDFNTGSGVSNYQTFTLNSGEYIVIELQWDDLFASVNGTGATTDIDIYLLDSNNRVIAGSVDNNIGSDPSEFFYYVNTTSTTQTYKLMIVCSSGDLPSYVKYINFGSEMNNLTYDTASSTCVGHANAVGAVAVGAVYYGDTPVYGTSTAVLEYFSSYGGTPLLFADDGTRLSEPLIQEKVNFVAPDGVSTTVSGFESFYGTSAAAPHAAAVAALLLDYDYSLSNEEVVDAMASSALSMDNPFGSSSYNYASGAGLIQADAAIEFLNSSAVETTTTVTASPSSGSTYGDSVKFTVTVSTSDSSSTPTGSVQFVIDDVDYGSSVTLTNGTASITISSLSVATHRIEVVYTSDDLLLYQDSQGSLSYVVSAQTSTISGTVWNDSDDDASFDNNESGLSGWVVYIDADKDGTLDSDEQSTVTSSSGSYTFSDLDAGTYIIREVLASNWVCTYPASTGYYSVTVTSGSTVTGKNFGNYLDTSTSSISGTVWNDSDNDGSYDSGESFLSGWTIFLDTDNDGVIDSDEQYTTTDSNGAYTFSDLDAGTYTVCESTLSGWTVTYPSLEVYYVTVSSGSAVTGKNFGNYETPATATIAGTVWFDSNNDGVYDNSETATPGWVVFIDADNDGVLDSTEESTTTDSDGNYQFSDLDAGSYTIYEVLKSGWSHTSPSSTSYSVTVAAGETLSDQDFGNIITTKTSLSANYSSGSTYGQTVVLTATISANVSSSYITGSVQFYVDSVAYGSSITLSNGSASLSTSSLTAGTHTITAVYTDDDSTGFLTSKNSISSYAVSRAKLTITADNQSMLAGNALPTFTSTITGFVNGETLDDLTTQPVYSTKATSSSSAGTFSIVVSGASSSNYTIQYVSGTLTIYSKTNSVFMMTDPLDSTKQALYVYGTTGKDVITITAAATAGKVKVTMNGVSRGTFAPTSRIIVHGLAGNDTITVGAKVAITSWLYGDLGNDNLWGGGGSCILLGGAGADSLWTTTGRGLLFGEAGADTLTSGTGDTMLIGGTTSLSSNDAALLAILNEWTSSTSYWDRVAHLTEGADGGLNDSYVLNESTVFDDSSKDRLVGNKSAMDIFFKNLSDVVTNKRSNETTISV